MEEVACPWTVFPLSTQFPSLGFLSTWGTLPFSTTVRGSSHRRLKTPDKIFNLFSQRFWSQRQKLATILGSFKGGDGV